MSSSLGRIVVALALSLASHGQAEVVLEDSGQTLSGTMTITEAMGVVRGRNLLHTFSLFNIDPGESATFTGDASIETVIARVTEGPSVIDGLLASNITDADLFLINPQGIAFGESASVDVDGSLYLAAARSITFADGSTLLVSDTGASGFSSAPPAAFGFDSNAGDIRFEGTRIVAGASQSVDDLGVFGGGVTILNSQIYPAGDIQLIAASDVTDLAIAADGRTVGEKVALGEIEITNEVTKFDADVETSGSPAGRITIVADRLSLDRSFIFSDTLGPDDGAGIEITLTDELSLANGSRITTDALAAGNAGSISIAAPEINLRGLHTKISSETQADGGNAGTLHFKATNVSVTDEAQISARSNGPGDGGTIIIDTARLVLEAGGQIAGQAAAGGRGADVVIAAAESVLVTAAGTAIGEESGILVNSSNFNPRARGGDAGDVSITAPLLVVRDGGVISARAIVPFAGSPGSISLQVDALVVESGGRISTETAAPVDAGPVTIEAAALEITGANSAITSSTASVAKGGSINIRSDSVTIADEATIEAVSSDKGDAGAIAIVTTDMTIAGGRVDGRTLVAGQGGNIAIQATDITLDDGGSLDTSTAGLGDAGSINLAATGDLTITGLGSRVTSATSTEGAGGNIDVNATNLRLGNAGVISVTSRGSGFAGDIRLSASARLELVDAEIQTNSLHSGGGNIDIEVADTIYLRNGTLTASAGGSAAAHNGGNITIDPVFLILDHSTILAQAQRGDGGVIQLTADNYIADVNSLLSATSELGNDGDVIISSPNNSVKGAIGLLDAGYEQAAPLLRDACSARALDRRSSLIVAAARQSLWAPGDCTGID